MRCDACRTKMLNVGSVGSGYDRRIYAVAFVCPAGGCHGYGAVHYSPSPVTGHVEESKVQHPAMTLMTSDPLHARIAGALAFKDGGLS